VHDLFSQIDTTHPERLGHERQFVEQVAQIEYLALHARAPGGLSSLADASAGIAVTRAVGIGTRIIAAQGLTPLFKARAVKQTFFGFGPADLRGVASSREQPRAQLLELDYKDAIGI